MSSMRNHRELREVFADFARLGERPGIGLSVLLGSEERKPELARLTEGERVLLIEWDNLCAEGTVRSVESGGPRYWSASSTAWPLSVTSTPTPSPRTIVVRM
jgi:hypothetical protein